MLTLAVDSSLVAKFPSLRVDGVRVRRLRRAAENLDTPRALADQVRLDLRDSGVERSRLASEPRIAAWREAVAGSGLKPSTYKSSVEQLARTYLSGRTIKTPLSVVNAYCAISAKHLAPLGGYAISKLPVPRVELRRAAARSDSFAPIGARSGDLPLGESVVVYASGHEIMCWNFNHRDSIRTCLDEDTDEAVFLGEAVAPCQHGALTAAMRELVATLKEAGAVVEDVVSANATTPVIEF